MISYLPYKAEHVARLNVQDAQKWTREHLAIDGLRSLENGWANTVMRDGVPVVCGGALQIWDGRAVLWSFVSGDLAPKEFREIHYLVKGYVEALPFRRVEAYVDCDFEAGHRWVKALGFELESVRMKAFRVDGADSALYARVRA